MIKFRDHIIVYFPKKIDVQQYKILNPAVSYNKNQQFFIK